MKTIKDVLIFLNETLLNGPLIMVKVIRLNKARTCLFKILSKYNNRCMGYYFVLYATTDNISLLLIDRNTEDLHNQINEFRINLVKLLCLESLYNRYQNQEKEMKAITNFRSEKWIYYYEMVLKVKEKFEKTRHVKKI